MRDIISQPANLMIKPFYKNICEIIKFAFRAELQTFIFLIMKKALPGAAPPKKLDFEKE